MDSLPFARDSVGAEPLPFLGILYAEDFDKPGDCAPTSTEPPPAPAIVQADVEAACALAVQVARAEWQASQEQARLELFASVRAQLAGLGDDVERTTNSVAEHTVLTILAMVSGMLPHFGREHGPAEVRALLGRLLPVIRSQQQVVVRVHPELVAAVRSDVDDMADRTTASIVVTAAPIEPGDVKVTWENGSMARDSRQIAQALQDALGQLGLHHPAEAPAKRMMAHA